MAGEGPAIGIDLGTTYSCVGVWKNGRVEIITNEQGNRTTPSCVAFYNHERLIGDGALNVISRNPTNTIFDAKRLIGRRYNEDSVQSDKKFWPFKVVAGDKDKPTIVVQYEGEEKHFSPEEISAMILSKMKECAEAFLGSSVKKAVVTVPAYFNNSQRQATKDAGTIAGLDVMHVLNEPTASALAYGLDNRDLCRSGDKKRILIFDLGGGTFDVSLLELDKHGVLEVKATAGDTHLGGQDFDNRMVDHLVDVFQGKYKKNIRNNPKCIRRLKTACEKAKRALSTLFLTEVSLDCLFEGIDFNRSFSRVKFEEINRDMFEKCLGPLKQCLEDAKVDKNSIDEVVLVGGSTRIPKVQEMLKEFFNGKNLSKEINPDEAVAYGASIQAASLNGTADQEGLDVVLLDVTPLSLGLNDSNGVMNIVIPRNTRIPCRIEQQNWCTASDNQTSAVFEIFEGERAVAVDNNLLGKFMLSGLRQAPEGEVKFLVIFNIDENGILHVSATNKESGDRGNITITRDRLTLNEDEIDRMIREARKFEYKDKERKKAILAKHELEEYASRISCLINESRVASKLNNESRHKVVSVIDSMKEWMEETDAASYYEYEHQKFVLERAWEPIRVDLERAGVPNINISQRLCEIL